MSSVWGSHLLPIGTLDCTHALSQVQNLPEKTVCLQLQIPNSGLEVTQSGSWLQGGVPGMDPGQGGWRGERSIEVFSA